MGTTMMAIRPSRNSPITCARQMAQTMTRFEGCRPNFRERRDGGIGAFTPDNVPVIGWLLPNAYMIADSNHGFIMLGVGKLAARYLMGDDVPDLKPFGYGRYAAGKTFGSTNSHSQWVLICCLRAVGEPAEPLSKATGLRQAQPSLRWTSSN
jgi:hypothetical protein